MTYILPDSQIVYSKKNTFFITFVTGIIIMKNLLLFLSIFFFQFAWAQEHFVFSPINSNHGLSDNRVRTIYQLSDGRMVVVTEGLVNIYNGSNFKYLHYNENTAYSLKEYSGYHRPYVDGDGNLWVKNQFKLMLFNIAKEQLVLNIDSVFKSKGIKNNIYDIFIDSQKNSWLLTDKDELILNKNGENSSDVFVSGVSNKTKAKLIDLANIDEKVYLFYRNGKMACYDISSKKELYKFDYFEGANNPYSGTIMVVPFRNFLYQARNGFNKGHLLRFNTLNKKTEHILETDYYLNTLTIDPNGTCWISSFSGLWQISPDLKTKNKISTFNLVDGQIFDTEINTQFNDNKGGLWVGTVNRGLLYYHHDRFKFLNFGRALFNISNTESLGIHCFADYNGIILVGTQSGLFTYDKKKSKLERFSNLPEDLFCEMLYKDSKGRIWLCTRNKGLFCIVNNKIKHFKDPQHCLSIFEKGNNDFYLCFNRGILSLNPETGYSEKVQVKSEKPFSFPYQLTKYKSDTLLGFGNEGLFLFDTKNHRIKYPESNSILLQYNNHHYHCLYTDSRGLIWFGTMDGLYVYNRENNSIRGFHEENGLVNNSIRSVIEDNEGSMWVSTSNGISCIKLELNKEDYNYRFINFNRFDGIIENEFQPRSALATIDGKLYWGGLDGFNETDLNRIRITGQQLYRPLFTNFSIAGTDIKIGENYDGNIILNKSITNTEKIVLKHFQNFFSIEFTALNYINPSQTYYRYKLEGVDDTWRIIKSNEGIGKAVYTNLSPGTYNLVVYAANNNQNWDNNFGAITIVIKPPFWKTIWAKLIISIFIIVLIVLVFRFISNQNREKIKKQQKEELDQIKYNFFTNISHELRTPLTLIITPLESIIKRTSDSALNKQLSGIQRNAMELLALVNQLLAFRKLEVKGETLNLSFCNLNDLIEKIAPSFAGLASEKGLNFKVNLPEYDIYINIDKDKIHSIINNLLSNAIKFTDKNGFIELSLVGEDTDSDIKIIVKDTGRGIEKNDLENIFSRFYQAKIHDNNTGSGIGLHLVKEYTELHDGKAEASSVINEGSVFTITLPAELRKTNTGFSVKENGISDNKSEKEIKILTIEDNNEFREFLFNELINKYDVITAINGKDGLEKAIKYQPDLIITDIMMPEMSGLELCKHIKNNLQISHIPVILLTAKSSDDVQIEALEAGADDFIAKPFNMDILQLKIQKIIDQQEDRKELFKKNIFINSDNLTYTHVDEELIRKVIKKIESNLDNISYSVEKLSKDMNMDRTGLYRKLSALTGQTPSELIRSVRLKYATQLLEKGIPVAEVAEKVGFSSTSYFTKCFQEEFGVKPSQFGKNHGV